MIGYARSVANPGNLNAQRQVLNEAGCLVVYLDDASAGEVLRPGLLAAIDALSSHEALVVVSLDRLARSCRDLFYFAEILSRAGKHLGALDDDIDTRRDNGAFFGFCSLVDRLHVAGAADRRAVARARSVRGPGPAPRISDEIWAAIAPRLASGELSVDQAAGLAGVHRSTIYRRMA